MWLYTVVFEAIVWLVGSPGKTPRWLSFLIVLLFVVAIFWIVLDAVGHASS